MTNKSSNSNHIKLRQYYKDIPVFGINYAIHKKDRKVFASNGTLLLDLGLDVQNIMDIENAKNRMLKIVQRNT